MGTSQLRRASNSRMMNSLRVTFLLLLFIVACSATAKHPLSIFHGAATYEECLTKSRVEDSPFARRIWTSSKSIIEAFRQNDPRVLWALIDFPLITGPLESELLSGKISDWFEPEVFKKVIEANPICRGFHEKDDALLDGNIWLNRHGRITSMPQTIEKKFDFGKQEMVLWDDGTYIPEHCIMYPRLSYSYIREFSQKWNVPVDDLIEMPGMMLSKKNQEPFCAYPEADGSCHVWKLVSLAKPKSECSVDASKLRQDLLKHGEIGDDSDPYLGLPDYYKVLGVLPNKVCEDNSSGDFAIHKCFTTKTTLYRDYRFGIHAIYEGELVGPIKFFDTKNELKEFLRGVE